MKSIFQTYTGSAFLNNALQTIEALTDLESVSEITPELILKIYKKRKLWNLFKRMKSYSMLFTRNGPLLNDKDFGEKIYKGLMEYILKNFENDGDNICEISGLRFKSSFEEIYEKVLHKIGYPVKKVAGKDKTINRCWFPLVGALGSDAQALPQAKFEIKVHPICLVIIQFLPFSALIYKGGILLFDSINFEFSKDYIEQNTERVLKEIDLTKEGSSVENIKDFNKGTYLLRAIKLFIEKKDDYGDVYSDLNLWSFSNSGTGASCEIDRVPNQLFKKLLQLYYNVECRDDLKQLLSDVKFSNFFLEKLEGGIDFWRLYPSKGYDGIGVPFYEHYQRLIGKGQLINQAKYIAFLLKENKELKKADEKLLEKWDAYTSPEYRTMIFTILVKAAENKKWSMNHHLQILDKPDKLPVSSATYSIFKMVHFYFQKDEKYLLKELPDFEYSKNSSESAKILSMIIPLIEKYEQERKISIQSRLLNVQESKTYSLRPILIYFSNRFSLEQVYEFYFTNYQRNGYGLNDLLRIYFSNPTELKRLEGRKELDENDIFKEYRSFASLYFEYYFSKYKNPNTLELPFNKFQNHVLNKFSKNSGFFIKWLEEAKQNMFILLEEQKESPFTFIAKKEIDKLFENIKYDELGNLNLSFARFAIQFSLNKIYSSKLENVKL